MLKKLLLAAAGLALSVPAFADRGHRGYRHYERPVVHRPVVVRHYYRPAPRPVYVVHRAPPPPPVVVHHHSHDAVPLLFGAIVGAAVVHSVLTH
jgi:hypothetical protein